MSHLRARDRNAREKAARGPPCCAALLRRASTKAGQGLPLQSAPATRARRNRRRSLRTAPGAPYPTFPCCAQRHERPQDERGNKLKLKFKYYVAESPLADSLPRVLIGCDGSVVTPSPGSGNTNAERLVTVSCVFCFFSSICLVWKIGGATSCWTDSPGFSQANIFVSPPLN